MDRNNLIDIAKGLGIILVVFGHNWIVLHEKGELFNIIFSFHMPLFFMLSGVFINPFSSYNSIAYSRFQALVKPYFVVSIAVVIYRIADSQVGGNDAVVSAGFSFAKILYGTGSLIPWTPLWFLPHLFLALLLSSCIVKIATYRYMLPLCASLLAIGYGFISYFGSKYFSFGNYKFHGSVGLPWGVDLLPITCSFVIFGHVVRESIINFSVRRVELFLFFLAFVLLHYLFDETIDFNLRYYGSLFVATAEALIGSYLCIACSFFVGKFKLASCLISYIGRRSLFVLIFHACVQDFFTGFALQHISNHHIFWVVGFVAGVFIPLVLFEAAKKIRFLRWLLLPPSPSQPEVSRP